MLTNQGGTSRRTVQNPLGDGPLGILCSSLFRVFVTQEAESREGGELDGSSRLALRNMTI